MKINELLELMMRERVSDLLVTAGKPPCVRKDTKILRLDLEVCSREEVEEFRRDMLLPDAEAAFSATGSFDAGVTFDSGVRFRINFFLQQGMPGHVARLVPNGSLSFKELLLPPIVAELAEKPRGLVLVVGAAGSGKSTTMAAILNHINANFAKHVVTIEDPIEFVHSDNLSLITQREVGADTANFADALRNVVRESPDAIFIGEMRDLETMKTAVSAALTGHLVVSTLHTSSVVQSIERIINHYPDTHREQAAYDLALALEGIIAQRLVPKADGDGMVPAVETLVATPLAKHFISTRSFTELEDVVKRGQEEGMRTFSRALADMAKDGVITVEEGAKAATNSDEFMLLVQGMESGIETFRSDDDSNDGGAGLNMKRLLHTAVANGASDLILTANCRPTLRLNGVLTPLDIEELSPSETKRLLFGVLNSRQREQFEEGREIDFALSVNINRDKSGKTSDPIPYRFRVNGFFQRGNIAIAVRVIPKTVPPPAELGLPFALLEMADAKQGMILVTGPTGHGKSTTLASIVNRINESRACHIITVEDPIEYVHPNKKSVVEQREVYSDTHSFSSALKYVLRQDPDVILVGEMRDTETIAAALTAAETGHLVLATLHTNDAAQSIDRIIDSFPAHQQSQIRIQLAGSLLGIISQRLLPHRNGKDRVAVFEVMVNNHAVKNIIREGKTHLAASIMETGTKDGMITQEKAVGELYKRNLITRAEAKKYISETSSRSI
ncbi:MAG: PilT/PilU family type 4a pilus ATPase [Victivallales bacterium]|nr:PilT/PilU family type 4a pilus ATPase [Victivallales bacterium]